MTNDEFLSKDTHFNEWLQKAKKDLKNDELESFLTLSSIEEVEYFALQNKNQDSLSFNTYPAECKTFNKEDFKKFFFLNFKTRDEFKEQGSIVIDLTEIHNAGGSIVQEGGALLYFLHFLSLKENINLSTISVKVSVSSLFFHEISKLRAMRKLTELFLEDAGIISPTIYFYAENSLREQTIYDPWVNLLRNTTSTEASILGGADFISTFGEDEILHLSGGEKTNISSKLSKNIPYILLQESHLGVVRDPASGSYLLENLSSKIIYAAWTRAKEWIEKNDIDLISSEVLTLSKKRDELFNRRVLNITGINNYPNFNDSLEGFDLISFEESQKGKFPLRRNARNFELLRARLEKIKSKLDFKIYIYGEASKLQSRIIFVQNIFEILGIPATEIHLKSKDELKDTSLNASINVLVANNEDYSKLISDITKKENLYLAGKIDSSFKTLYMGQNIYAVLEELTGFLEVKHA